MSARDSSSIPSPTRGPIAAVRRVGIIARNELKRTGGSFDRRTTALLLVMALAMGVIGPTLFDRGMDFDHGIYRAAVTDDASLLPAVLQDPIFRRVAAADPRGAVDAGDADIAITGSRVYALDTPKGNAALAALKQAAKDYSFVELLDERDQAAAFPVRVELNYVEVARDPNAIRRGGGGVELPDPEGSESGTRGGSASGGDGSLDSDPTAAGAPSSGGARSGFSLLPPERAVNTPETMAPPFPFRSLILAYMFLVPMNFVVQVYAGSSIAERLGRKGEALLASPARPWEIVMGKALPYFALMMLVSSAIAYWIGGGWLSVLAVVPLVLAFLALEFVAAMFARSFRELTFLTVFSSVLLTIYAFLPAVFTDVHPVALVSPITLIVMDLRGTAVDFAQIAYAMLPLSLASAVLFVLGTALYREEDLFHQKPVLAKAVDALARQVRGLGSGFKLTILLMPFVLVGELLLVTFLFAWPVPVGLLGVLVAVAFVEELFKGAPSYAAIARGVVPAKRAIAFGALAGVGFFVAEKGFLLASLAGLMDVPAGAAVFGAAGAGSVDLSSAWWIVAALLLMPLLLHVVTAGISAWGARFGKSGFKAAFMLAIAIHTAYNYMVVTAMGGGWSP